MKVQEKLGDRLGREIFLLSITLDPAVDDPPRLAAYAARHGARDGWLFLTGGKDGIDALRRRLGIYDRDPELDKDRTRHMGMLIIGNEATGQWSGMPTRAPADRIAKEVLGVLRAAPAPR